MSAQSTIRRQPREKVITFIRFRMVVNNGYQCHGAVVYGSFDDPFAAVDQIVRANPMGKSVNAIFLDFHGEATSEKKWPWRIIWMGGFSGHWNAYAYSNNRCPNSSGGTALQCDAG